MTTSRDFPHAMLREIFEQPAALAATLDFFTAGGALRVEAFASALEAFAGRDSM